MSDTQHRAAPSAHSTIVVQPNASLSVRQAWAFMAGICTVSFSVAGYFAAQGYWPVLPFAGLEMLALGLALWSNVRHNAYREVLRFEDSELVIEFGMAGRGLRGCCRLPRGMTRVWLERGFGGAETLVLACGQQRLEIGRCLGPQDRASLHARVKELLLPGWQNSAPEPTVPAVTVQLGE